MRLHSIKLSGFKSFVEPTHFQLRPARRRRRPERLRQVEHHRCGALGPRRKQGGELRGESMQDVIFNGTNLRSPPAAPASRLVFDNSEARAGGPWNRFAEIAVKRVLTRDGEQLSHQRPAGAPARHPGRLPRHRPRPRAYAIIGRERSRGSSRASRKSFASSSRKRPASRNTRSAGARPSRLKDTRENLTRVDDILRELTGNLEKLESQAEVAGATARCSRTRRPSAPALVPAPPRRGARAGARRPGRRRRRRRARIEERRPASHRGRAEAIRQTHYEANDALHAAQGALGRPRSGRAGSRRIRYVAAGRERLVRQRAELERRARPAIARERCRRRARALGGEIEAAERAAESLAGELATHASRVAELEEAREARSRNAERGAVATVQQQIQVSAAEARGVDERLTQAEARRERLVGEEGLVAIEPGELEAAQRPARRPRRNTMPRSPRSPTGRRVCRRSTRSASRCRTSSTRKVAATPT
jgi:chromosome segregation protein